MGKVKERKYGDCHVFGQRQSIIWVCGKDLIIQNKKKVMKKIKKKAGN